MIDHKTTRDTLLDGKVLFEQRANGYRSAIDAVFFGRCG